MPAAEAQGYCYGAPPARLQIGGQGRVTPGLPNSFRSQPYRGYDSVVLGEIPAGGVFTITGGPNCYDGMYWWQVNYNGQYGWTPEGQSGVYWVEPYAASTCMNLPTRLVKHARARAAGTAQRDPHAAEPELVSTIIGQIPAGAVFSVLSGVSCANGMTWRQISYYGTVGWTAEGQYGQYWLEPY